MKYLGIYIVLTWHLGVLALCCTCIYILYTDVPVRYLRAADMS